MKKFVVVDGDGNISYGFPGGDESQDAGPESFDDIAAAESRAKDLAACEPGKPVGIYAKASEVLAEISEPTITPA